MSGPAFGVTRSPTLQATFGLLERLATTGLPLLLQGEPGTGKQWLARRIHELGQQRPRGEFVRVDLSEQREVGQPDVGGLESCLTDALTRARAGTLFLSGLERLDPGALERALELLADFTEWGVTRRAPRLILSARQGAIAGILADGALSAELMARLNLVPVLVPPLRERPEDLVALIAALSPGQPPLFELAAMEALRAYGWPGNVGELAAELARLRATCRRWRVALQDLAPAIRGELVPAPPVTAAATPVPSVDEPALTPEERPLGGSLLLMAARDGELPPAEAAALEDRFQALDPLLQAEWAWLERTRAALSGVEPAPFTDAEQAALQARIAARLAEDPVDPARRAFERSASQVSLRDLEQRGFRQVKVLRAGDINQLIMKAVQTVLGRSERGPLQEIERERLLSEARTEVDLALAEARRAGRDVPVEASPLAAALPPPIQGGEARPGNAARESAWRAQLERDVAQWLQHLPLPGSRAGGQLLTAQVELAAQLEACAEAGGDGFGWEELAGGEVWAWIHDASSKGLEAASLALETSAALRAAIEPGGSPADALARVNRALVGRREGQFVAGLLLRWDPVARRLTVCNGGHEPPALRRARTGRVELLRGHAGVVLGAVQRAGRPMWTDQVVELEPGDALLLYTDGACEVSEDPDALRESFLAAFAGQEGTSAPTCVARLLEHLRGRVGPPRADDRAVMVLRRL